MKKTRKSLTPQLKRFGSNVKKLRSECDITQEKLAEKCDLAAVRSEELTKVNNQYVVTGKAINTIEKYTREQRKHNEVVRLQCVMVVLTLVLVLVSIVQSGLIKLPTFWDWSDNSTTKSIPSNVDLK